MAELKTVHCNQCKKDVCYHYEPVNHLTQLVLVVITLGLWLPMWLWVVCSPTKMCNECDGPIWNGA